VGNHASAFVITHLSRQGYGIYRHFWRDGPAGIAEVGQLTQELGMSPRKKHRLTFMVFVSGFSFMLAPVVWNIPDSDKILFGVGAVLFGAWYAMVFPLPPRERITEVAIKLVSCQGLIFSLRNPNRHCNVFDMMGSYREEFRQGVDIQGFVTDSGRFVNRKEAAKIAFAAGQTPVKHDVLFSEDVW
jgi:hypothetical protein